MTSKNVINLALLAVIAALGAVAYFEPGVDKVQDKPIAKVDADTLDKVTLTNKDTIVFEKKNGHWTLTAPFKAPVNEIRVRQLVDIGKAQIESEYPVKPEDLARYELDKPKARLQLGDLTLAFGGSDPINMRRYVLKDQTLYLVSDDFYHHLMAAATDYVDKKLLPDGAKVREIDIPGLKASLGQDGKWTREPAGAKPDLGELANLWSTARAIDVKQFQGAPTGDKVRIGLGESGAVEFVVTQKEPDLVLVRPDLGLQFELTGETSRQLLNLPKVPAASSVVNDPAAGAEEDEHSEEEELLEEEPASGDDEGASETHGREPGPEDNGAAPDGHAD